jgi:ankyrin repeat domain-containing protein 50
MLAQLPAGIEGLYAATLTRVEALPKSHRDLAMRVLLWLVFAHRSMSVEEVQYAAAAYPEAQTIGPSRLVSEDTIISACCGLVTVSHRSGVRHPISQYESGYRIIRLIRE